MGIFISEPCFIDGYQAYHAGLPVEANPFLFQANPLRLWCHGWNVAMLVDLANQGIFELPGDFGTVDDNAPGYKRIDKEPFDQGRVAYAKGLSQADCPYGPETTHLNGAWDGAPPRLWPISASRSCRLSRNRS
jgi:ribosome modulation factor